MVVGAKEARGITGREFGEYNFVRYLKNSLLF
jgi:hypothetical protein